MNCASITGIAHEHYVLHLQTLISYCVVIALTGRGLRRSTATDVRDKVIHKLPDT